MVEFHKNCFAVNSEKFGVHNHFILPVNPFILNPIVKSANQRATCTLTLTCTFKHGHMVVYSARTISELQENYFFVTWISGGKTPQK